jgi:hypothetical protein
MDLPDLENVPAIPIPPEFHSFELEGLFRHCAVCNRNLLEDGVQYTIEKAFARGETIFEYAMCFDCVEKMRDELSLQSRKRIEHYFDERVDLAERRTNLLKFPILPNAKLWLNNCVLSGRLIRPESDEYQIYAHCDGGDLLFAYAPYSISGKTMDDIEKLLSEKTRDRLDDFIDEVLGIPGSHQGLRVLV